MDIYRYDWLDAETASTQSYLLNTLLVKVTTRNFADDDLGSNIVSLSVPNNWYENRVAEGKVFIIFKVDNAGNVYSSLASCHVDVEPVTCTAEFSGRAGGFSVFGLAAVLDAEASTPSPASIIATLTRASVPEVPASPSTMTPTPELTPITPTPVISEDSGVEELPTPESTPEVEAKPIVPSTPEEWLQGKIVGEVVTTATPSPEAESKSTETFARLMSPTAISIPSDGPTIDGADQPSGNLALPAYLGIAVSMVLVLVGGAAYVYRFRLSLFLEDAERGRYLSRILTYRSFGYIRYRWEKAKSEWESARKYHRQVLDKYLNDNQEKDLREAERRHDEAFKRLRRSIAEDIISLTGRYRGKRRRPK